MSILCRNFKDFDKQALCSCLRDLGLDDILRDGDINHKVDIFTEKLVTALDVVAPYRAVNIRHRPVPWMTDRIVCLMKERDREHRKYVRSGKRSHFNAYRSLRNQVQANLRLQKNEYFKQSIQGASSSKLLWDKFRELGLINTGSNNCLPFSAEEMSSHFFTTYDGCDLSSTERLSYDPSEGFAENAFFFKHITTDVLLEILASSSSPAVGTDRLALGHILSSLDVTLYVILDIFNESLSQAYFPLLWKCSLVKPLPKGAASHIDSLKQLRPISLLCALSKPLEKIVHKQLIDYCSENNLFDPRQSAFRKGFNTQTALLRVVDDVRQAIDKRMVTILVLFDFKKAFDTISHSKMLLCLKELGLSTPALNWFQSYLTGRSQSVVINNSGPVPVCSTWKTVPAGVPQGSVLGPLLFNLYIRKLPLAIRHCNYMLFADDLQIYLHTLPKDIDRAIAKVNEDICSIYDWAGANFLQLNRTKTKAMLLGTSNYLNTISLDGLPRLVIGPDEIEFVDSARNLGVVLDSSLSWHDHVSYVCSRVHRTLYMLRQNRSCLSVALRKMLVRALIFPYFDYCNLVFINISQGQNTRLQRALNCCIRFIFDLRRDEHITPYFNRLSWLKIDKRRKFNLLIFLQRLFATHTPAYIHEFFTPMVNVRDRPLRSTGGNLLCIPNFRTELYRRSFAVRGAEAWNELEVAMRNESSPVIFRRIIFQNLLDDS